MLRVTVNMLGITAGIFVRRYCLAHQPYLPKSGLLRDQRGFGLVETVVSIAVLSLTSVALVGAMSTGYLGFRVVEKDVTAGRLATSQMEYTKAYQPYRAAPCPAPCLGYPIDPTISPIPAGYTVTVAAYDTVPYRGPDIEKIIVTVTRGTFSKKLEDYKRN